MYIIGYMHRSHFALLLGRSLPSFTGVTDDTNEGSVPFWSNRVRVLLLCMLAQCKHSATPVGLKVFLYRCVTLRVTCKGPFGSICTLSELWGSLKLKQSLRTTVQNGTEPSLVSSVTPVKEGSEGSRIRAKWLLCI